MQTELRHCCERTRTTWTSHCPANCCERDRRRQDMNILPCMTNATVLEQAHHAGRQQEASRPGPRNLGLRQTNIIRWYEPCEPCVVLEGNELLSVAPGPKGDFKSPSQIYRINERLRLFARRATSPYFGPGREKLNSMEAWVSTQTRPASRGSACREGGSDGRSASQRQARHGKAKGSSNEPLRAAASIPSTARAMRDLEV